MVTTSNIAAPSLLGQQEAFRANSKPAASNADEQSNNAAQNSAITEANPPLNSPATVIALSLESQSSDLQAQQKSGERFSRLLQEASTGLASILSDAQAIDDLVEQAEATSLTDQDRGFIRAEITRLQENIDATVANTSFDGIDLLSGAEGGGNLSLSANTETNANVASPSISLPSFASDDLFSDIDVSSASAATTSRIAVAEALSTIQTAAAEVTGDIQQLQASVANFAQTQAQNTELQQNGGLENDTAFNQPQLIGNSTDNVDISTQQSLLENLPTSDILPAAPAPVDIQQQAETKAFDFLSQEAEVEVEPVAEDITSEELAAENDESEEEENDPLATIRDQAFQLYAQTNNAGNNGDPAERVDIRA